MLSSAASLLVHVLKAMVGSHEIPAEVFFKAVPLVRIRGFGK